MLMYVYDVEIVLNVSFNRYHIYYIYLINIYIKYILCIGCKLRDKGSIVRVSNTNYCK